MKDILSTIDRRDFLQIAGIQFLLATAGCTQRNAEGRKALKLVPASVLKSQAKNAYNEQKKNGKLIQSGSDYQAVKRATKRAIEATERLYPGRTSDYEWEVVLFDDPKTVNAYAMPGGKVALYSGILPMCKNEAGASTVIGHEFGHIINKHSNERVSQQIGASALIAIGTYALSRSSAFESDVKKAILYATGAGVSIGLILPFSRKHEHEADRMGIRLMAASGYDPSEAPRVWKRFADKYGSNKFKSYLSTHPASGDRMERLDKQVPEMNDLYQASRNKLGLGKSFV